MFFSAQPSSFERTMTLRERASKGRKLVITNRECMMLIMSAGIDGIQREVFTVWCSRADESKMGMEERWRMGEVC